MDVTSVDQRRRDSVRSHARTRARTSSLRQLLDAETSAGAHVEKWEDEDFEYVDSDDDDVFDPWQDGPAYETKSRNMLNASTERGIAKTNTTDTTPSTHDLGLFEEEMAHEEKRSATKDDNLSLENDNIWNEKYIVDPAPSDGPYTHVADIELPYIDDSDLTHIDDFNFENWKHELQDAPETEPELFEYEPEARQDIWEDEFEEDSEFSLQARQKAAEIISRMSFTSSAERTASLYQLIDLFKYRKHHATYYAILAAADSGVSGDTLRNMVTLREIWENRQDWWRSRYGWGRSVIPIRNGGAALTWKLARAICEARSDYPPEYMIDEAWMQEWLCLHPRDDESRSFPRFIRLKVMSVDENHQNVPDWSALQELEHSDFGDTRISIRNLLSDIEFMR